MNNENRVTVVLTSNADGGFPTEHHVMPGATIGEFLDGRCNIPASVITVNQARVPATYELQNDDQVVVAPMNLKGGK
jgi:hypothetical protein